MRQFYVCWGAFIFIIPRRKAGIEDGDCSSSAHPQPTRNYKNPSYANTSGKIH